MVSAVHGVMITADVPIKQYILHLNDVAPAERKFVVVDLDARRVLVALVPRLEPRARHRATSSRSR